MPRFFIRPEQIAPDGTTASVVGDDARHISRSLRMRVGEELTLCDGECGEWRGEIAAITADSVTVAIGERRRSESEPPYRAVVYQAVVRGERFEAAVQKSVEFGAAAIVPVTTRRVSVKLGAAEAQKKRVRWQRIAAEAAMQCGRGVIPEVRDLTTFEDAIRDAAGLRLFCYEQERSLHLRDALSGEARPDVAVFVGPEGGFSPEEAAEATAAGAVSVSLGRRILRTESAAPFVLAGLSMEWEMR